MPRWTEQTTDQWTLRCYKAPILRLDTESNFLTHTHTHFVQQCCVFDLKHHLHTGHVQFLITPCLIVSLVAALSIFLTSPSVSATDPESRDTGGRATDSSAAWTITGLTKTIRTNKHTSTAGRFINFSFCKVKQSVAATASIRP